MLISNWPGRVANKTVTLLGKWIERRVVASNLQAAFVPQSERRHIFHLSRDESYKQIINIEIIEGICGGRGTAPREWTDLDEFGFTFLDLSEMDQLIILAAQDPFMEFRDRKSWQDFLNKTKIWKEKIFQEMLERAMIKLQQLLERKGLVKIMPNEKGLHGWNEISNFLKCSVPKALKLAKEQHAPITLLGGSPYTTEEKLERWMNSLIDEEPYWKIKGDFQEEAFSVCHVCGVKRGKDAEHKPYCSVVG